MFRPPTSTPSHGAGPASTAATSAQQARTAPTSTSRPSPASSGPLTTVDPTAFDFVSHIEAILALVQEGTNPAAVGSAVFDLKKKYDDALALLDRVPDANKSIREVRDQLQYRQEHLCERKSSYMEYQAMATAALLPSTTASGTDDVVVSPATSIATSVATASVPPSLLASPTSTAGFESTEQVNMNGIVASGVVDGERMDVDQDQGA